MQQKSIGKSCFIILCSAFLSVALCTKDISDKNPTLSHNVIESYPCPVVVRNDESIHAAIAMSAPEKEAYIPRTGWLLKHRVDGTGYCCSIPREENSVRGYYTGALFWGADTFQPRIKGEHLIELENIFRDEFYCYAVDVTNRIYHCGDTSNFKAVLLYKGASFYMAHVPDKVKNIFNSWGCQLPNGSMF